MIEQVADFFERFPHWKGATLRMHGEGLLQHLHEKAPA
jgi:hypothetical protein